MSSFNVISRACIALWFAFTLTSAVAQTPTRPAKKAKVKASMQPSEKAKPAEVTKPSEAVETFYITDRQPEFPGGRPAMDQFIKDNLQYPVQASVSGKVFLAFTVDTVGHISNVQVLRGIGFGCDEEAVRLVKAMPIWKPGMENGRPAQIRYNLPIMFSKE
jgi:periplasmic protein TonB